MGLRSSFWNTSLGMLKIGHQVEVGDIRGKVVFFETTATEDDEREEQIIGIETENDALIRILAERKGMFLYDQATDEIFHWLS